MLAEARWPEPGDGPAPTVPGFVHSMFPPLVAAVADRCLTRRHGTPPAAGDVGARTAVLLASAGGDRASADHVHTTVATGGRVGPLFFYQSVPNSIAGHVAARWGLGGPVLCLSPTTADPRAEATAEADLLLYDGDADEALLVLIEQTATGDHAVAVLLGQGDTECGPGDFAVSSPPTS
ncbi:beta-ketoacyl synthase N-terminal-like domain-containing protein [Micromonospora cathayae]|uniref:Beta-ketoacyl synthase N-terminal-like domain-containing protein n=1 Tax=Micromonospora cathayae TaxID=3028804 RepID=A0ABY7ZYJ3_9ACTN|nr:beta-ketoacyl synthase N-terminal-like domain-containing protein [Micromonospora sp. HUAS 3]WDZ88130.1 beta-ketoacyl synthase N-terminal-like domain-containing protein [Micromonospora sp. HUAS 3]